MKRIDRLMLFSCASITGVMFNGYAQEKPNVLIFLVDDLGWKDLACTGSNYYETPNIDRIASQGVIFTESYSASTVSSPSRASIQTGKFTARHGVTDWIGDASGEAWRTWRNKKRYSKVLPAHYKHELDTAEVTIAEAFHEQGYITYHLGKWHLGGKGSLPENHGYDVNIGGYGRGLNGSMYFSPYGNPKLKDGPAGENLTTRLGEEAAAIIKKHKKQDSPFFLMLNFFAVHSPIQCSKEKWEYFRDKAEKMGIKDDSQAFVVDRTLPVRQYQDNPVYAGLISHMDDAVGIVMRALEKTGLDKNTIVVFTSDNGGVSAGEHYQTSNLPLRGGKGYQWDGGLRVPLIIQAPGSIKNREIAQPAINTDLYPTLLDLAGLSLRPEQHMDGISLKEYIINPDAVPVSRRMYWHYPHYGSHGGEPSSIIRDGDWKLIYYHEDLRTELYNNTIDKTESGHLNAQYPEQVEYLKSQLLSWLKETGALMPIGDMEYHPVKEAAYKAKQIQTQMKNVQKTRKKLLDPNFKPLDKYCKPEDIWWGQRAPQKTDK